MGLWGIYSTKDETPKRVYDSLRAYYDPEGKIVGFSAIIAKIRQRKPNEYQENHQIEELKEKIEMDTFCKIAQESSSQIIISKDDEFFQEEIFQKEPSNIDVSNSKAFTTLNLYSGMARIVEQSTCVELTNASISSGIALVHVITDHYEFIEEVPSTLFEHFMKNWINTLKKTINVLNEMKKGLKVEAYCFINMGQLSGASIPHLHAQSIIDTNHVGEGRGSYSFKKSYRETLERTGKCLVCEYNEKPEKDQLGQKLLIDERTIFANENWLCMVALAAEAEGHLRLIPRRHRSNLTELTEEEISDLASALLMANKLMYKYNGKRLERNVLVREDYSSEKKMHMIIDILPIRNYSGGSSLSDLAVCSKSPMKVASEMKKLLEQ
ncbi:MAG: HIT domain-containing protein [Candidatus Kariarchaeaceae archaeon]